MGQRLMVWLDPRRLLEGAKRLRGSPAAQAMGHLMSAQAATAFLAVCQGIIVARVLGPAVYGEVVLVLAYPKFVNTFFDTKSSHATIRFLGEYQAKNSRDEALGVLLLSYLVDLATATLAAMIVTVTAGWSAGRLTGNSELSSLMLVVSAGLVINSLRVSSSAALVADGKWRVVAALEIGVALSRTILITGAAFAFGDVVSVIWAHVGGLLIEGLASVFVAHRILMKRWGRSWLTARIAAVRPQLSTILRFLLYTDLNSLLNTLIKDADILVLGYFTQTQDVGYYRLAKSIAALPANLTRPLQSVIYPRFVNAWVSTDKRRIRAAIVRSSLYVSVPSVLAGMLILPMVSPVMRLLAGEAFAPAAPLTVLLLISGLLYLALFWLRPVYLATDRARTWFMIGVGNAILSAIAYPIGAYWFGAVGVAWSRLIAGALYYGQATAVIAYALHGRTDREAYEASVHDRQRIRGSIES